MSNPWIATCWLHERSDKYVDTRRSLASTLPVLFLVNDFKKNDMINGFNAGADGFMAKPVLPNEIKAYVSALLRRAYSNQQTLNSPS